MRFMERILFGDSRDWACSQASGDVLEVAVGTGLNFDAYPHDVRLTGIDTSEQMLAIASNRARELGREVELRKGDAHVLPFADATFDTVVSTFGLCAIPDIDAALDEMTRVLRPRGKLILVDHVASFVARGSRRATRARSRHGTDGQRAFPASSAHQAPRCDSPCAPCCLADEWPTRHRSTMILKSR
jgi:SAM-dependent methyltransferase